mmetsp:Transcript_793/g.3088  ORF Transcript_793/g.3088 Transcript_793/m.3088 type:complete len:206 (-) Transcript_793:1262-1879(-)
MRARACSTSGTCWPCWACAPRRCTSFTCRRARGGCCGRERSGRPSSRTTASCLAPPTLPRRGGRRNKASRTPTSSRTEMCQPTRASPRLRLRPQPQTRRARARERPPVCSRTRARTRARERTRAHTQTHMAHARRHNRSPSARAHARRLAVAVPKPAVATAAVKVTPTSTAPGPMANTSAGSSATAHLACLMAFTSACCPSSTAS